MAWRATEMLRRAAFQSSVTRLPADRGVQSSKERATSESERVRVGRRVGLGGPLEAIRLFGAVLIAAAYAVAAAAVAARSRRPPRPQLIGT